MSEPETLPPPPLSGWSVWGTRLRMVIRDRWLAFRAMLSRWFSRLVPWLNASASAAATTPARFIGVASLPMTLLWNPRTWLVLGLIAYSAWMFRMGDLHGWNASRYEAVVSELKRKNTTLVVLRKKDEAEFEKETTERNAAHEDALATLRAEREAHTSPKGRDKKKAEPSEACDCRLTPGQAKSLSRIK